MAVSFGSDIHLSKTLSWLLRHSALKQGLQISSDGYVDVNEILRHKSIAGKYSLEDIKRIVNTNDKQRFELSENSNSSQLLIKAVQGHSINTISEESLTPVLEDNLIVIHGTFLKNWNIIKLCGLNRMKRNHIHFATGILDDINVTSGMRKNCEVYIYINIKKALSDGIKFFKSQNGVILSPGNSEGILEKKYFLKVISVKDALNMDNNIDKNNSWCDICKINLSNETEQITHKQGKKHKSLEAIAKQVFIYNRIDETQRDLFINFIEHVFGDISHIRFFVKGNGASITFNDIKSAKSACSTPLIFMNSKLNVRRHRDFYNQKNNAGRVKKREKKANKVLPKIFNSAVNLEGDFENQLKTFVEDIQSLPSFEYKLDLLCTHLKLSLNKIMPGCEVTPFGSAVTNLSLKDSDVDCFVYLTPEYMQSLLGSRNHDVDKAHKFVIKLAKNHFYKFKEYFSNIIGIPNASVPIVKFLHIPTNINCDVSFKGGFGVHNSQLLNLLVNSDSRIRPLLLYIKFWMKTYDLLGFGRFTSYALSILFIFYLQQIDPPILPPIEYLQQNNECDIYIQGWNCGFDKSAMKCISSNNKSGKFSLLEGFFKFYSDFDFSSFIICPLIGSAVSLENFKNKDTFPPAFHRYAESISEGSAKYYKNHNIYVQDPFVLSRNITASTSNVKIVLFQSLCKLSYDNISKMATEDKNESILSVLLKQEVEVPKKIKSKNEPSLIILNHQIIVKLFKSDPAFITSSIQNLFEKILLDVLKIKLQPMENDNMTDNSSDVILNINYDCRAYFDVWTNRKTFYTSDSKFTSLFDKEVCVTEKIVSTCKNTDELEPIFVFYVHFVLKNVSLSYSLVSDDNTKTKFRIFKNFFNSKVNTLFNIMIKDFITVNK